MCLCVDLGPEWVVAQLALVDAGYVVVSTVSNTIHPVDLARAQTGSLPV